MTDHCPDYDDPDEEIIQTEEELGHAVLSYLAAVVATMLTAACVTLITIYAFTH